MFTFPVISRKLTFVHLSLLLMVTDKKVYVFNICAALVGGVALGLANPTLGCLADSYNLSKFSTFGIFAIAGNNGPFFFCLLFDETRLIIYVI